MTKAHDSVGHANQIKPSAGEDHGPQQAATMYAQLAVALERISDAFFALDAEWRFTYVNHEARRLLFGNRSDLLGTRIWDEFPEIVNTEVAEQYRRAAQERTTVTFQALYPPCNAWFEIRAYASDGGLSVIARAIAEPPAAQDLRERETGYRALVEAAAAIVWHAEAGGDFVAQQPAWSAFTGQTSDQLQGWGWLNAVHPDEQARTAQLWSIALAHRSHYCVEHRLRRFDGVYRCMLVQAAPVLQSDGSICAWIGSHTDITDLTERLRQSRSLEERYRDFAEVIPVQVWTSLPNGQLDYVSQRCAEYFAVPSEELLGQNWLNVVHPDDHARTIQRWSTALLTGEPYAVEFRLRSGHDGSYRWHLAQALPLRDEQGRIIRWFGTNTDIEHQKQAEAELRQNERWLETTLKSIGDPVIATNAAGYVTFMNSAAESLTGWTAQTAMGQPFQEVLPLLDKNTLHEVESPLLRALRSGTIVELGRDMLAQDRHGRRFPIISSSAPIHSDTGATIGVVLVFRDVTEPVQTEQRLHFLAELSQLLASSLDYTEHLMKLAQLAVPWLADLCAIHSVQPDGTVKQLTFTATDRVLEMINANASEEPIQPPEAYGPVHVIKTAQTEFYREISPELLDHLHEDQRNTILSTGLSSWICIPLISHGSVLGSITLARAGSVWRYTIDDVAFAEEVARRAALAIDNALLYREAQEAIQIRDAFLSIASHELKTPLASVLGYAELLRRRTKRSIQLEERDQHLFDMLAEQIRRLHRMVQTLFDLSRLNIGQLLLDRQLLDLGALAARVVKEIEPTLQQHALYTQIGNELTVLGDDLRLEQVLVNLIQNAIKYSPQGGPIFIRVARAGEWVQLSVRDHGLGIPSEALPHIFERFYRVSNSVQHKISGMGVGLYIAKEMINLHNGRIEVTSVMGRGSTFTVWLPYHAADTLPESSSSPLRAESET